jgi:hypothetical protein
MDTLPEPALLLLLKALDPDSLVSLASTCKRVRAFVLERPELFDEALLAADVQRLAAEQPLVEAFRNPFSGKTYGAWSLLRPNQLMYMNTDEFVESYRLLEASGVKVPAIHVVAREYFEALHHAHPERMKEPMIFYFVWDYNEEPTTITEGEERTTVLCDFRCCVPVTVECTLTGTQAERRAILMTQLQLCEAIDTAHLQRHWNE